MHIRGKPHYCLNAGSIKARRLALWRSGHACVYLAFLGIRFLKGWKNTCKSNCFKERCGNPPRPPRAVRITDIVTVRTEHYRYLGPAAALNVVAEQGTLIAHDGDRPITTPYPDCVILMPSLQASPGQTAMRLGRLTG